MFQKDRLTVNLRKASSTTGVCLLIEICPRTRNIPGALRCPTINREIFSRHFIKSNPNRIVFTIFRLICNSKRTVSVCCSKSIKREKCKDTAFTLFPFKNNHKPHIWDILRILIIKKRQVWTILDLFLVRVAKSIGRKKSMSRFWEAKS